MQLFDLQLGTSLRLELERAPEIEGPVPGRVERDCGKPGSAPAGQAAAFAGAREVTPHQVSEGKDLKTSQVILKEESLNSLERDNSSVYN